MELRQIEHFLAVVEEQHFTRAARRCNLSQSALSASIKSLERDLNAQLFVRTTRHVELSDAGQALLDKARLVLSAVVAAQDAVSVSTDRLGGSIDVGGIPTNGILDQVKLLAEFHQQHPQVALRYTTGTSIDLINGVRAHELDVAFISVPAHVPTGLEVRVLATFPMALVCRWDHRLAGEEVIDLDMLGEETFVGGPALSVANDVIARVHRMAGTQKKVTLEANDLGGMLEFAANGLGVALLPSFLADERSLVVAVPFSDPAMIWTVGVVMAPYEKRTRATGVFLEMLGPPRAMEDPFSVESLKELIG